MINPNQPSTKVLMVILGLLLLCSWTNTVGAQVVSPCIVTCVQPIAEQNGCMFQNTTCVCGNAKFQTEAAACLEEKCTAEEQQEALQLQKRQCGPLAITPTTPAPTSTPSGPSTIGTSSSPGGVTASSPAALPTTFATTSKPATSGGTSTSAGPGSTQTNSASTNLPLLAFAGGITGILSAWTLAGL